MTVKWWIETQVNALTPPRRVAEDLTRRCVKAGYSPEATEAIVSRALYHLRQGRDLCYQVAGGR